MDNLLLAKTADSQRNGFFAPGFIARRLHLEFADHSLRLYRLLDADRDGQKLPDPASTDLLALAVGTSSSRPPDTDVRVPVQGSQLYRITLQGAPAGAPLGQNALVCDRPTSRFGRVLWPATASFLFLVTVSLNLLIPTAAGPADNGDFNRIFSSFSTGPVGLDYWPPSENQAAYQERFYNHYHRFWRFGTEYKRFAQPSTSRLFFWPGRVLRSRTDVFDLAWNAGLLTFLAALLLFRHPEATL